MKTGFQESEDTKKLKEKAAKAKEAKPAAYSSAYTEQLDRLYDSLSSRKPFQYNPGSDVLYNQYRSLYQTQGRQAMRDSIGQTAGLTGGYSSTYAQNAGQQAYNTYLQRLNEKIPELYRLSQERYDRAGDSLRKSYELLQDKENAEYGRYRDSLSDYYRDAELADNAYNSGRSFDYKAYSDMLSNALKEKELEEASRQWQADFDEGVREFDLNYSKSSGSSKSGGVKTYDGLTADQITQKLQSMLAKMPLSQVAALVQNGSSGFTSAQARQALSILQKLSK